MIAPTGPLRVQFARRLKLVNVEIVVQLVDVLVPAPIFGRSELRVGALDVKLARAEEAPVWEGVRSLESQRNSSDSPRGGQVRLTSE